MKPQVAPTLVFFASMTLVLSGCVQLQSSQWPESVQSNYMNACLKSSDGLDDYCHCTLDGMQKRFTADELGEWEKRLAKDPSVISEVQDIINSCAAKYIKK